MCSSELCELVLFKSYVLFCTQRICTGMEVPEGDSDKRAVPLAALICVASLVLHLVLALPIAYVKRSQKDDVVPFNYQNTPITNLGNMMFTWTVEICIGISAFGYIALLG